MVLNPTDCALFLRHIFLASFHPLNDLLKQLMRARSLSISHGAADTETTSRLTPALEARVGEPTWGRIPQSTDGFIRWSALSLGIDGPVTSLRGHHPGSLDSRKDSPFGKRRSAVPTGCYFKGSQKGSVCGEDMVPSRDRNGWTMIQACKATD